MIGKLMYKVSDETQEDTGWPSQVRTSLKGKDATFFSKTVRRGGQFYVLLPVEGQKGVKLLLQGLYFLKARAAKLGTQSEEREVGKEQKGFERNKKGLLRD